MFARLSKGLSRLRRRLSRSESVIRWLGLSRSAGTADEPGLVLIQIDGLSQTQLERAIKRRRMPLVRKLIRKRGYAVHTMYSGIPSTTPAVQGELFYGVKCAVPAFSYRDPTTGQIIRMFDCQPAAKVQDRLAGEGEGLLAGGSAYANIYSGGAAEPRFCAATMGWSSVKHAVNPLVLASIIFWHSWSIVRMLVLVVLELGIAVGDLFRGRFRRRDFWQEVKFIPTRVAINIGLREMVTAGAVVDVTRGLPVVQVNLLGYDEQSHLRGPSSAFAHWTLKGIDDAIKRIWVAARKSQRRRYSLWIYSDHGQEKTTPYQYKFGRTVQQAIAEVFGQDVVTEPSNKQFAAGRRESGRAQWLGGRAGRHLGRAAKKTPQYRVAAPLLDGVQQHGPAVEVVSLGPLGHVYPGESLEPQRLEAIAERLVHAAGIPMVLASTGPDGARAWTKRGMFDLPADAAKVLGPDHPFLDEAVRDLVCLCNHPGAGVLVIVGWDWQRGPISFAVENGAHAGPGTEETRAFALLPSDAPLDRGAQRGYLRPLDLRRAALRQLGREVRGEAEIQTPAHTLARAEQNGHAPAAAEAPASAAPR